MLNFSHFVKLTPFICHRAILRNKTSVMTLAIYLFWIFCLFVIMMMLWSLIEFQRVRNCSLNFNFNCHKKVYFSKKIICRTKANAVYVFFGIQLKSFFFEMRLTKQTFCSIQLLRKSCIQQMWEHRIKKIGTKKSQRCRPVFLSGIATCSRSC